MGREEFEQVDRLVIGGEGQRCGHGALQRPAQLAAGAQVRSPTPHASTLCAPGSDASREEVGRAWNIIEMCWPGSRW